VVDATHGREQNQAAANAASARNRIEICSGRGDMKPADFGQCCDTQ